MSAVPLQVEWKVELTAWMAENAFVTWVASPGPWVAEHSLIVQELNSQFPQLHDPGLDKLAVQLQDCDRAQFYLLPYEARASWVDQ